MIFILCRNEWKPIDAQKEYVYIKSAVECARILYNYTKKLFLEPRTNDKKVSVELQLGMLISDIGLKLTQMARSGLCDKGADLFNSITCVLHNASAVHC